MFRNRNALVIGTVTALSQIESGASLRLYSIGQLLETAGLQIEYASPSDAKALLRSEWEIIAVVSFSSAKFLRVARKQTKFLWFDPTDSWILSRISLLRAGDLKQFPALARDLFYLRTAPKVDLISFITRRDALSVRAWVHKKSTCLVMPNSRLERIVQKSNVSRLVFMGDGKYLPNRKALKFLQRSLAGTGLVENLHVYGDGFPNTTSGGIFHGYSEGSSHFKSGDIHLAPIFYGAGMKMKVAVPLFNGLRVLTTPEGATGFKNQENLHIAKTADEFQKAALELYHQQLDDGHEPKITDIYSEDESVEILKLLAKNSHTY